MAFFPWQEIILTSSFSAFFEKFFRCMCTVSPCRRCKCIAPVMRNHFRYIRYTCPNLWCNPCSKCYETDCFGTYFTHAQTCDVTRGQSVVKVLRKRLLRYILHACPNLWCNPWSKCYGTHFFGTYFTHVQTCDVTRGQNVTEWTASVHTSHMSNSGTEWLAGSDVLFFCLFVRFATN